VSQHVGGARLADVLSVAESFEVRVDNGTALEQTRQLTVAIGTLHATHTAANHICHGCIGPERLIVTAEGRLIVTEYVLGSALAAMRWPRDKFWYESRIALPSADGPAVFDQHTDIMQIGLLALALLESRAVYAERRYPLPLAQHVAAARAVPIEGTPQRLPPALIEWLARALRRDRLSAFRTIDQVLIALERVIHDEGYDALPSAVADFLARCREASPDLTPRDLPARAPIAAVPPPLDARSPDHTPAVSATAATLAAPAALTPAAQHERGDPIEFVSIVDESPGRAPERPARHGGARRHAPATARAVRGACR
jgi:hypothetical protein